jgi:osmotically-inducible protein OsmY
MRLGLLAAGGVVAAVAYLLDPQRRQRATAVARQRGRRAQGKVQDAQQRTQGAVMQAGSQTRQEDRDYDDVTLARKVESEVFRPAGMHELKSSVSVNVADGVVELRGEVPDAQRVSALGEAAGAVAGVREVNNLLHTPGTPPKHSPPSTPDDVRERARHESGSGFADSPASGDPADPSAGTAAGGSTGTGAGSAPPTTSGAAAPTTAGAAPGEVESTLTGDVEAPIDTADDPAIQDVGSISGTREKGQG